MKKHLLLATLACLLLAGCTQTPTRKGTQDVADTRAFIEISHLIAPKHVDNFTLINSSYDSDKKFFGASFRYRLSGFPGIRFDVFVYPAGRGQPAEKLESGMTEFRRGFDDAKSAGHLHTLSILQEDTFTLPQEDDIVAPSTEAVTDAEVEAIVNSAYAKATRQDGRVLRMQMQWSADDLPMHSNGYLFYKHLYYFKVRASAPMQDMDAAHFNALTDMAASALVPAFDIVNIGSCANMTVYLDTDASQEEIMRELVTQAFASKDHHCFSDAQSAELSRRAENAEVVDIHFDASDWVAR